MIVPIHLCDTWGTFRYDLESRQLDGINTRYHPKVSLDISTSIFMKYFNIIFAGKISFHPSGLISMQNHYISKLRNTKLMFSEQIFEGRVSSRITRVELSSMLMKGCLLTRMARNFMFVFLFSAADHYHHNDC